MTILTLSSRLARNADARPNDVLQAKRALNRLGYYTPDPVLGLTEYPDEALFFAIRAAQNANTQPVTGILNPDDPLIDLLNQQLSEFDKTGFYIWRTVGDAWVRSEHARRNGNSYRMATPLPVARIPAMRRAVAAGQNRYHWQNI